MNRIKKFFWIGLWLVFVTPSFAQIQNRYLDELGDCLRSQTPLACYKAYYAHWDAALNATYQEVLNITPDDAGKNALRVAQRAWITYRDAEGALAFGVSANNAAHRYDRLALVTRDRVRYWRMFLLASGEEDLYTQEAADQRLSSCIDRNTGMREQSRVMRGRCYEAARQDWDVLLNEAYQNALRTLNTKGKALLKTSQRNWLAYRTAEVAYMVLGLESLDAARRRSESIYGLNRLRALDLRNAYEDRD